MQRGQDDEDRDQGPGSKDDPAKAGGRIARATGWRRLLPHASGSTEEAPLIAVAPADLRRTPEFKREAKPKKPSHKVTLRASISELLLVSKLRARSLLDRVHGPSAEQTRQLDDDKAEVLARYAKILAVTCEDWFDNNDPKQPPHQRRM